MGKSFAEQIDEVLSGNFPTYSALKVCDTPQILLDVGCEQLPMLYTQRHLRDALHEKSPKNIHWHGLTKELLAQIPEQLKAPAVIYDSLGDNHSIVVATTLTDEDNLPIVASIMPSGQGNYQMALLDSNFVTSIHGRSNFGNQLIRAITEDKLLFIDKEKSQEILPFQGLQLSEAISNLDSNIIIRQSRNIVKGFEQEILGNAEQNHAANNTNSANEEVGEDEDENYDMEL